MSFQYFFKNVDQPTPRAFLENLRRFDDIRPYCAKSLREGIEPVRSITVPGGLYHADKVDYPCAPMSDWDFREQGYEHHADTRRVLRFVQYLLRSNVPVDPNFTVDYPNFLNGEDFHATEHASCAVLVGFILNEKPTAENVRSPVVFDPHDKAQAAVIRLFKHALALEDYERAASIATDMATVVSPRAKPERWRERLSGARIIASIHRVDEIHLDSLGLEDHTIVMSGPPLARKRLGADVEGSGPPRDHWEFAIRRDFEAVLRPHFSQNTLLGSALAAQPMAQPVPPPPASLAPRLFSRFRAAGPA